MSCYSDGSIYILSLQLSTPCPAVSYPSAHSEMSIQAPRAESLSLQRDTSSAEIRVEVSCPDLSVAERNLSRRQTSKS